MSKKKSREQQQAELKRARTPGIIAFLIAVLAFAAFIWLGRSTAPPYPKPQTNAVQTPHP
jgi:hypothetical protein